MCFQLKQATFWNSSFPELLEYQYCRSPEATHGELEDKIRPVDCVGSR